MVEALAVVVDDPPAAPDVVLVALDQRLVDVALVELGIAHEGNHPAGVGRREAAVGDEIVLNEAGEEGDGDAQADAAGREVDGDAVLGPARVALCPAEAAEAFERIAALCPKQIMDRMEDRPGVRLDRDLVVAAERVEVEHRHDRGDRRTARLMPADLQPVGRLAQMVGMMDGPRRQPAQPRLETFQHRDRRGVGRRRTDSRCGKSVCFGRGHHRAALIIDD